LADRKVKGTMLVDLVRMIRANKDKDWGKHLTPEDWNIINKRILPSEWYPLEIFQRCGMATFQLLAQGNLDLVRLRGRIRGKELFENVYKSLIISQDPAASLSRFVTVYGQLFNFSSLRFENLGKGHAKIHHDYDASRNPGTMPYCHQLMGILDVLVEIAGGKNVKIELDAKQWEGATKTIFDITWE
jgi:hypothetical protein